VITPRIVVRQWTIAEFSISGAPSAANPFDPDQITIKGTFTSSSGKVTVVEGFWYQGYNSILNGANEVLTSQGAAEWRLRFTPEEPGQYQFDIVATTPTASLSGSTTFTATAGAAASPFKAP